MKWLLNILGVAGLLAALCLCSILVGRAQPRENPLLRFDVNDCDEASCITPIAGVTGLPSLTLGELVVEFGEPCSLTMIADAIYVQYADFTAEVSSPRDVEVMRRTRLKAHSPVNALLFFDDSSCDTPVVVASSRNIYVRWCGFTTLGQYIDRCRLPGLVLLPE